MKAIFLIVRMGAWGQEGGEGSVGIEAWGRECRDGSMGTGALGKDCNEIIKTGVWGDFFCMSFVNFF